MTYWLFNSARDYVRRLVPYLLQGGGISWSAPSDIEPGDLALLYELGEPTDPEHDVGRMQIEWVFRARSRARPDPKWSYVADVEAAPLVPLPLPVAKRSRRFAAGPGATFRRSFTEIDRATWSDVVSLIDAQNRGFAASMATAAAQDAFFRAVLLPDDRRDGGQPVGTGAVSTASWPNLRLMQAHVGEAIFEEGWAEPLDTEDLGLTMRTERGYTIPRISQYADDLLVLHGGRVVAVVVYDTGGTGKPGHSVARAVACRNALRASHPEVVVCAVVIAERFSMSEREAANNWSVECLRVSLTADLEVEFTQVDFVKGPVSKARSAVIGG